MTAQYRPGYRVYRKLLLAFFHKGEDCLNVRKDVALSLLLSVDTEPSITVDTFLERMKADPVVSDSPDSHGSWVTLEIDSMEFIGSEYQFLRDILDYSPEIRGIMAVDMGEVLSMPPLKIMTADGLTPKEADAVKSGLVYALNLTITEYINAAAELDQPDVHFVELRD